MSVTVHKVLMYGSEVIVRDILQGKCRTYKRIKIYYIVFDKCRKLTFHEEEEILSKFFWIEEMLGRLEKRETEQRRRMNRQNLMILILNIMAYINSCHTDMPATSL